jgi:hypothetical protein
VTKSQAGSQTRAGFSIANPQKTLPLAKVGLEAHAFGDLKCSNDASLDLLACCRNEMEGKSAPQIPARRTNEHESSLNDALAVRGSIRAATSRNLDRVLMQVVDHQSYLAHEFEPMPTDYKSGGVKIGQISIESGPVGDTVELARRFLRWRLGS